jgi:hypothetical protein
MKILKNWKKKSVSTKLSSVSTKNLKKCPQKGKIGILG